MRRVAATLPAALSLLLLGAHFLRDGALVAVGLCLLLVPVAFVRRAPAVFLTRGVLLIGAGLWISTAVAIARARLDAGAPWIRMAVILAAVALFALVAAWLLPGPRRSAPEDAERT